MTRRAAVGRLLAGALAGGLLTAALTSCAADRTAGTSADPAQHAGREAPAAAALDRCPPAAAAARPSSTASAPAATAPVGSAPAASAPASSGSAGTVGDGPTRRGQHLPPISLPCLSGDGVVQLDRLTGTPAVVNLWASWCAPCREELPAFQRLHAAAGDRLRVLGVVTEDARRSALAFVADAGVHFPSVLDDTGRLKRALGRSLLPATVLVAPDGTVVEIYTGPPLRLADLRELVQDRLGVRL